MHQTSMVLVILVFLALTMSPMASSFPYSKRVHVYIVNDLGSGKILTIHCQSKDDDLGVHSLDFEKVYTWSFKNIVYGETLFYCDLEWERSPGEKVTSHVDVYDGSKDIKLCGADCWRMVQQEGIFALDPDNASVRKMGSWAN
ncbi:S-protein homolog 5-like [Telopea speciosissima]|uniref:S-protein homolog 5-like n=1 Tax=Telopea speciosissima TaxID=54955 RepID=UPI001CC74010|nr:S-protein homolog 5-like [Telopea speciosissima]